jgi:Holliday junction resolvase|tara:strand:+ start:193 stop:648 length:456 start_codon:yes stop_codon:yes gene_type:complete
VQSESSIQKAILKLLNARDDVWAVKTITTNRNGTPDIIASVGGHFVAIEVKAAKGVVAPLQTYQIDLINKTGGTAGVARSTGEVKDMLTAVDKMSLIDGDFEKISGVDRAITDTLIDLRETLEQVEDELRALLGLDDISDGDIRHVLKILN